MNQKSLAIIILAAGRGTRMKSATPKVLHQIAGRSLIAHVIATAQTLIPAQIIPVIAPDLPDVLHACAPYRCAQQEKQKGTGDAVSCALPLITDDIENILVLTGDAPLVSAATLEAAYSQHLENKSGVTIITMQPVNPKGYGRIKTDNKGIFIGIVEEKDANDTERNISIVNSGVMFFSAKDLRKWITKLQPNNTQGEYYLTDIPKIASDCGFPVKLYHAPFDELRGVNDRAQLAEAELLYQKKIRQKMMQNGVTLLDPDSIYFSADTEIASDVTIEPHVFFGPDVKIESGVTIRAFCHLEGVLIKSNAQIGPFARLRPATIIGENAKIGNFVEIKKSHLGAGAKASHLSYIGDASVGMNANIGAGTITCNYDGFNKHITTIGNGVFVGSNSTIIAPVRIDDGAFIAAGSIITGDVEKDALAFARTKQINKSGWAKTFRDKNKKKDKK